MTINDGVALTFGPVPSRRLGRSLGINNIPPKFCSYGCLYCQVGRTVHKQVELRTFYQPADIYRAVQVKIADAAAAGEKIDYLTFVPDGEPTLDIHLGETIKQLKNLNVRIAVISNASLVWREEIQQTLNQADLVSLKIDAVDEVLWRKINRPHEDLKLPGILQGISKFATQYPGELITETMLVAGINDSEEAVTAVADFLQEIHPAKAYVAVPTRPTAEVNIAPPGEELIVQAYNIFNAKLHHVEYLIGYEGNEFAFSGDLEQDLLSITAVHPLREEAVNEMLEKAGLKWDFIQGLLDRNKLKKVQFAGKNFYLRKLTISR